MSDISTLVDGLGLTDEQISKLTQNLTTLKSSKLLELDSDIARAKEGMRITYNGLDLIAKGNAGQQIHYTRVALGDAIKNGKIYTPTDEEILDMNKLVNQRDINLPIADVRFGGGGTVIIRFQLQNAGLTESFWAREIGLFARDPDTNAEILYAYKNFGALASFITAGDSAVAMNLIVTLITIVDQTTNVTAVVDANLLFVTEAEFIEHVNSTKPHPNIPNVAKELSSANYIWTTGTDNQLHPISAENLQTQLLGSSLYELPHLDSRIAQTEINLANLYTQLGAVTETGFDTNLLLTEDFSDSDSMIDQFSVKVNDAVAGADNACVETLEGILEGHYYTITDGVRSQYVQVRSLATNDDLNVVFFNQTLKYTFKLADTSLYRSPGLIADKTAGGAGDVRESMFNFADFTWTGEVAAKESTLALNTTLANQSKFTLSGDWDFDSNGMFTIAVSGS